MWINRLLYMCNKSQLSKTEQHMNYSHCGYISEVKECLYYGVFLGLLWYAPEPRNHHHEHHCPHNTDHSRSSRGHGHLQCHPPSDHQGHRDLKLLLSVHGVRLVDECWSRPDVTLIDIWVAYLSCFYLLKKMFSSKNKLLFIIIV